MKRILFSGLISIFLCSVAIAQVSINPNGSPPHPSAGLEISFPNKGFLLPRLTFEQMNNIPEPAEGLLIYCVDCNTDGSGSLAIFQNQAWRAFNLNCAKPNTPTSGIKVPATTSIEWKWNPVPIAEGYKWGLTPDYESALDLGDTLAHLESGLSCWTEYIRYVWAYNECGASQPLVLTGSTTDIPFTPAPTPFLILPTESTILWSWQAVPDAVGYRTISGNNPDFYSAQDIGDSILFLDEGLDCLTEYKRYVWAYDECGFSSAVMMTAWTTADPPPSPAAGVHTATSTEIIWDWNSVTGADSYLWNDIDDTTGSVKTGTTTSYSESNLNCLTNYTRYVWSLSECGLSDPTVLQHSTLSNPPTAPAPAAHVPSAYQVVWNWNVVEGVDGYRWGTSNDYNEAEPMGTLTSKTETGLNCNTDYTRYVWAYDECGVSGVTILTQKTSLDPPDEPVEAAHTPSPNQIIWNWNPVAGATGYRWGVTNVIESSVDVGNVTSRTETGLNCNSSYSRYVWAYSSCGTSGATTLTQVTSLDPPDAPVAATHNPGPTQITWNWNAVAGATGYRWSQNNDYENSTPLGNNTSTTQSGLTCNTPYVSYVWAYSSCGVSEATQLSQTTALDPPAAPVPSVHVATANQITWNWNSVPTATYYLFNDENDPGTATNLGNVTTYIESNLTCFTPYTRFIWAASNCGISLVTSLSKTTDLDPPDAPVAASHIPSYNQIVWNWNSVPDATGYKWWPTNDYNAAQDMGSSTTKTQTSLECTTGYTSYVWAYSSCGHSVVTLLSEETTENPPAPPTPGTHNVTATSITWNWNAVAGADGYKWNTSNNYQTAFDLGTIRTVTQNDLTCNTPYSIFVWAYSVNCGVSTPVTLNATTAMNPPAIPTAGTHVPAVNAITWNWNPVAGATGYKFSATNNYATASDLGNVTTWNESLPCNASYVRFVWAYNGNCGNSGSRTLSASTLADPPELPVAAVHVAEAYQITWKWHPVQDATGYRWNSVNDLASATPPSTDTSSTQGNLTCLSNYNSYVWAVGPCGTTTAVTLTQMTGQDPPDAPSAATHIASANGIEWHFNTVPEATGYRWDFDNNPEGSFDIGTNTTWTETNLACNTLYTRYVFSVGPCGTSAASTFTQSTLNEPPATPVSGSHVPAITSIEWKWNPVAGAVGYLWNTENTTVGATDKFNVTSHTEINLGCNLPQTAYVWAYNGCGNSTPVTLTSATLLDPPAAPAEGTHIADVQEIEWHWNAVSGATGYLWNTVNDTTNSVDVGNLTTYTESGLTCNSAYTRYVWAYSNCGLSGSTTLTKTTITDPPASPVAATHTSTVSQITWNWDAVTEASGYKWNTSDNYGSATDLGNVLTVTSTNLSCNQSYTRYFWAYGPCGVSASTSFTFSTTNEAPAAPAEGTHIALSTQITWDWNPAEGATGYRWGTTDVYSSSIDVGTNTSYIETTLSCSTYYERYVWAYGCGNSTPTLISASTTATPPDAPTAGTHIALYTQITWNWTPVAGAAGYKWSTVNNYSGATDNGTSTTKVQAGLNCGTSNTSYAWAYDGCGNSTALTMTQNTLPCWTCTNPLTINHVADTVAPVDKTVTYGTVTNIPGETTKCWITSNLGADQQAIARNDATEASAGWYWQFNRARGFKHDGTTRTPNTTWITEINEYSVWITQNDPCNLELGTGWRVPTITEWTNIDAAGGWVNWNGPYNSELKIHAAGRIDYYYGTIADRGSKGYYWSSTQTGILTTAQNFYTNSSSSTTSQYYKAYGFPIRCVKNP